MTGPSVRELAFLHSPVPVFVTDGTARVVDVNDAYLAMTRRTRDEVVGALAVNFAHADDLPVILTSYIELDAGSAAVVRHRRRHRRGDGTWIEIEALTSRVDVDGDRLTLVQCLELGEANDVKVDAEAQARLMLQPFGDAGCFHDDAGRIAFATANLAELLGRPASWFHGRRLTDPDLAPIHPDGGPVHEHEDPVLEAMRKGEDVIRTLGMRSSAGTVVWVSVRAGPVRSGPLPARSSLRDISELIQAQEETRQLAAIVERELTHRADHDSLTGLKARHVIVRAIDARLDAEAPVSVVFVDLDGFKTVNDDLGHLAGDDVLVAVAEGLRDLVPVDATLGRSGGDEFVAVFGDPAEAERFADAVSAGPLTGPPLRPLWASVGVAHSRPDDTCPLLLQRADEAMYAAKRAGRRR